LARPDWSRKLPRPLKIPTVTTLHTLADVRQLVEKHLPAECRERETWRHVAATSTMSKSRFGSYCSSSRCRVCPNGRPFSSKGRRTYPSPPRTSRGGADPVCLGTQAGPSFPTKSDECLLAASRAPWSVDDIGATPSRGQATDFWPILLSLGGPAWLAILIIIQL
jgi:hypothetical protein